MSLLGNTEYIKTKSGDYIEKYISSSGINKER